MKKPEARLTWTRWPIYFESYHTWLKHDYPEGFFALMPGASEIDLQKLERVIGKALAESYRQVLSIHNGQNPECAGLLASTERIIEKWQTRRSSWQPDTLSTAQNPNRRRPDHVTETLHKWVMATDKRTTSSTDPC